jgi:hypothetical protein
MTQQQVETLVAEILPNIRVRISSANEARRITVRDY